MARQSTLPTSLRSAVPQGAQLTKRQGKDSWYVYFQRVRYDKVTRKEKIFKEYIGSVALTNGQYLFAPNDKYLLSLQKADELRESLEKKRELSHLTEALDKSIEKHQADPRCLGMITYPLKYILLVVLLAAMNGIRDCKGAAIYWAENREWFVRNFEDFPDKDISHDTIRRLLCLLNESKTEAIFNELVSPILKARIQEKSERTLALDGQAVLASRVGSKTPYLLNVYDATNGVAITTELVDKKTNEMTVAPRLIRKLNLSSCTLTCDALNTQRKTVNAVIAAGGNYCCAVKKNHKDLLSEIEGVFLRAQIQEANKRPGASLSEKQKLSYQRKIFIDGVDLNHGRIEQRVCEVLPAALLSASQTTGWDGLDEGCIIRTTTQSTQKKTGETSSETRYFISSHPWNIPDTAKTLASLIRNHWGIENGLHHVLDVNLGQDWIQAKNASYITNRIRMNHLAFNFIKTYQAVVERENGKKTTAPYSQIQKKCSSPQKALKILKAIPWD